MRANSPETLMYASKEECILVFLATGEKTALGKDIQEAYNAWQKLTPACRWDMNMQMQKSLKSASQKDLYYSLIRGFDIWDHTQNIDGAPGWSIKDSSVHEVAKHMGEDLLFLLHAMGLAWKDRKNRGSKMVKSPEFRRADSEASILAADVKVIKRLGKRDGDFSGAEIHTSVGKCADELPDCLPSISNEEKVEKFKKSLIEQGCDSSRFQAYGEALFEPATVAENHEDVQTELILPSISKLNDSMDTSLEENAHLQNLRLHDSQDDSDFEKQISPLESDDEE